MGKIYAFAKEVAVWLGPERDNSKAAFQFIKQYTDSELLRRVDGISPQDMQLRAVMALLGREYWERAWIIQEVFQARKISIYCGLDVLCWSDLAKFFRRVQHEVAKIDMNELYGGELSAIHECTAFRLTKDRTSKNRDLHVLMLRYKNSLCSDPRDKVFSLCGMSQKHAHLVDYSKSPQDLWRSTLFSEPETEAKSMYRVRTAQLAQETLQLPAPWTLWNSDDLPEIQRDWPEDRLRCTYDHLNIIAQVSPVYRLQDLQSSEVLREWYNKFQGPNMPSLNRVINAARGITYQDLQRLTSFKRTERQDSQRAFRSVELWTPEGEVDGVNSHDMGLMVAQSNSSAVENDQVRLFTTHNGRLGFAACNVKEGTEIKRFSGSDVALVSLPSREATYFTGITARVFIINSDRSRDGYTPIQDPSYRYAVPDREDKVARCERLRDADRGEGRSVDAVRSAGVPARELSLDSLQFWTW